MTLPEDSAVEHKPENSHEEVAHEHTLFAEPIFDIGGFRVTNSVLNSWLVVLIVVVVSLMVRKNISRNPGELQNAMEMTVEGFLGIFDSVTRSRDRITWAWRILFIWICSKGIKCSFNLYICTFSLCSI